MKVLIIEDEPLAAERLTNLLPECDSSIEIEAVLESVTAAIDWLSAHRTDLIFLDIHLSDGLSFEIFDRLPIDTPVIFTTAYDNYAVKAFQLNSIDYLLKPFDIEALLMALEKLSRWREPARANLYELLQAAKLQNQHFQKRFLVYTGQKIKTIPVESVAYFFAENKSVFLVSTDKVQYLLDFTLDNLEKVLDPQLFFRVNRQFILGLRAIETMYPYTKGRVKIDVQPPIAKEVIVSVDRAARFKMWLNQ